MQYAKGNLQVQTLIASFTTLVAVLLSACGVGGGGVPIGGNPEQVLATTNWGSPGGSPANTRLSNLTGPTAGETSWTAFSDSGTHSNTVVTPDRTVVMGTRQALIAFNPDGSIRWRLPVERDNFGIHMTETGTLIYRHADGVYRHVDQDGTILFEYESEYGVIQLLAVGNDNTMYFRVGTSLDKSSVAAIDGEGNFLFQQELGDIFSGFLALPDRRFAFTSTTGGLTIVDSDGTVLLSDTAEDRSFHRLSLGSDGTLYVNVVFSDPYSNGYMAYSLNGTDPVLVEPDFPDNYFRFQGVTHDGGTVWTGPYGKRVIKIIPDGSIAWQYEIETSSMATVSIGRHGNIFISYWPETAKPGVHQLVGLNPAGETILSMEYERNQAYRPGVGEFGELYLGNDDKFFAYNSNGELDWSYDFGGYIGALASTPDGTILYSGDNVLYATSPAGEELWRYSGSGELGTILVGNDGNIYANAKSETYERGDLGQLLISTSSEIVELSPDGNLLFELDFPDVDVLEISLSSDGHLYCADSSGTITALLPGLTPSWKRDFGALITTRITIGDDETLYFGGDDGQMYAIDLAGNELWTFDMQGIVINTPAVIQDAIYATSGEGGLFKLGLDGTQLWRFEPLNFCNVPPAVGPDGTVFFGTSRDAPNHPTTQLNNDTVLLDLNGSGMGLYAVNPDGTQKWNLHSNVEITEPVCVDVAGNIYLGIYGQLFSINPDGTVRWRNKRKPSNNTAPLIGGGGSIVFGTMTDVISIGPGN